MSATIITKTEKEKLYTQALHLLGMPVRGIELVEEQMDTFLELSVSEYEQYVSDWLIESQWAALNGLNVDTQSLTKAFTTRSIDYETQFTYSYSKIVGLQANGPWELKKDSFDLVKNQQMYVIPAGREINELLWFTRATLTDSIVDPFIGGFGGKKEKNEVYEETAIREMVEELFNVTNVSFTLIINIKKIIPLKTLHHNNYYILVYTFDDLLTILAECNKFIKSDLYEIMPTTIESLIFNRLYNEKSEISTLCLLPKSKFLKIEKDFTIDVSMM